MKVADMQETEGRFKKKHGDTARRTSGRGKASWFGSMARLFIPFGIVEQKPHILPNAPPP